MFRLWGKTFLHNRMTNDIVVCNDSEESRTSKIFQAVTEISVTSTVTAKQDLHRIISLTVSTLIIWRYR